MAYIDHLASGILHVCVPVCLFATFVVLRQSFQTHVYQTRGLELLIYRRIMYMYMCLKDRTVPFQFTMQTLQLLIQ